MAKMDYRRRAVLTRIQETLSQFYLQQEVDWQYDIRKILDAILEVAMKELEFGEGRSIDHALIIIQRSNGTPLEVGAGWRVDDEERAFSRTIIEETLSSGKPVLCENARHDPRFENAESIQSLEILSLLSVPIIANEEMLGALYIERRDAAHLFMPDDREFLLQFADTIAPYVKTALIHQEHVAEILDLKARTEQSAALPHIIGDCAAMEKVVSLSGVAAGVERTVMITGESGCGKELLAQAIHAQSRRNNRPFVVVDCSALTESLLESELFGHVKGSFTGAVTDKLGAFEQADGGTLFLDEISDASMPLQQNLRRVLQEGEIRRVGENEHRPVDVRVVCATNKDLEREVAEGRFLHDLYHRVVQFPIRVPSLRERKEDIPLLIHHFIASYGLKKNPPVGAIKPQALAVLVARDWTANNVRELENFVKLSVDLCAGEVLDLDTIIKTDEIRGESSSLGLLDQSIPLKIPEGNSLALDPQTVLGLLRETASDANKEDRPYYRLLREFSGKLIVEALRYQNWKLRPAARLLGISPVKIRQDLKYWIEASLNAADGDVEAVSEFLNFPEKILQRKLVDLGITHEDSESTEKSQG